MPKKRCILSYPYGIFKAFVLTVFTMVEFQNYMEYLLEENWIIDFLFNTQQQEI